MKTEMDPVMKMTSHYKDKISVMYQITRIASNNLLKKVGLYPLYEGREK